jgi:hypothetical protein
MAMPSIKVQVYFGAALVSLSFSPMGAMAQDGLHHFHCHVLRVSTKTVYTSPIIATDMTRGAMMQDWHKQMQSAYSLTPVAGAPDRYDCVDLGSVADKQQAAISYDEQSWAAGSYKVVHVDYAPGKAPTNSESPSSSPSAVASTTPDPTLSNPSSFPTVRAYMSCSTAGTAGATIYYTGVFAADLRTGNRGRGGRNAVIIDRKVVDPESLQAVLDRFQAYLTQQGDKFAPGNV